MAQPRLRFKEFSSDWEVLKLGDISIKVGSGNTPSGGDKVYTDKGIPFIRSQNVINNQLILDEVYIPNDINAKMKGSIVKANDILLNITGGSIGRSCVVPSLFETGNVNQHVCIIRLNNMSEPLFYQSFLSSSKGQKLIYQGMTGSGREGINFQSIRLFKIPSPLLPEQEKIATFISSVDKKIEQLTKKKELLERYKKGVLQKVFKQEISFKKEDGSDFPKWEEKALGEVFTRVRDKNKENNLNVLTISAQQGLINQEKYFNKSVSAKDVTGYYLLDKGDFAYNKSYSKGYPMGAIKRLKNYEKGVVSTLYICFRIRNNNSPRFYEKYFDSGFLNKELHKIAQEGARNHGLLNMSVIEFFKDIPLPSPSLEEQELIADFIERIENKIAFATTQLEQSKNFKKGLLQQLFI